MAIEIPTLANDTVTLALRATDVSMSLFSEGTQHCAKLVTRLTHELANDARVEWRLDNLATAAIRQFSTQPSTQ